eukprot:scaffold171454_cov25-Tisochrysis_lutea.AAC.2
MACEGQNGVCMACEGQWRLNGMDMLVSGYRPSVICTANLYFRDTPAHITNLCCQGRPAWPGQAPWCWWCWSTETSISPTLKLTSLTSVPRQAWMDCFLVL